jgi:hypothetical protein
LDMQFLGTIAPDDGSSADQGEWIMLIGAHSSLAMAPAQQGINPFTKQSHLFKPAPDYASVLLDGTKVGAIHWAIDGSNRLVVWSVPTAKTHVIDIAQDVASRLSWCFALGIDAPSRGGGR